MSNRNRRVIRRPRKPKVSLAMLISQGLGGPKVNPYGVTDGQPVNIPARLLDKLKRRTTILQANYWIFVFCLRIFPTAERNLFLQRTWRNVVPRKVSVFFQGTPYLKPTQVGWYKYTKGNG